MRGQTGHSLILKPRMYVPPVRYRRQASWVGPPFAQPGDAVSIPPTPPRTPLSPADVPCTSTCVFRLSQWASPPPQETQPTRPPPSVSAIVPSPASRPGPSSHSVFPRSTISTFPPSPPSPRAPDSTPRNAAPSTDAPHPADRNRIALARRGRSTTAAHSSTRHSIHAPV